MSVWLDFGFNRNFLLKPLIFTDKSQINTNNYSFTCGSFSSQFTDISTRFSTNAFSTNTRSARHEVSESNVLLNEVCSIFTALAARFYGTFWMSFCLRHCQNISFLKDHTSGLSQVNTTRILISGALICVCVYMYKNTNCAEELRPRKAAV
ncbi:hypothetical protein LDENG_00264800 [Lucifuga dentata]|nr:hypothetical protein LDENG_00264800 [Lucifuga dentata]